MPTARLIDINTAAIVYRTKVLMSLDKHSYENCMGALFSMNSLLPSDNANGTDKVYRVIIDQDRYDDKVNGSFIAKCGKCETEHQYEDIHIMTLLVPKDESLVTGKENKKIWNCPKCDFANDLEYSTIIEDALEKPYYYRYVPEPPEHKSGLMSQLNYHDLMKKWVWLVLTNIEEAFSRFRDDNWNKTDEFGDDVTIDTSLEEGAESKK